MGEQSGVPLPDIPQLTSEGDLPRGRFCATLDSFEARFVTDQAYEGSTTREQVWSDFKDLLDLIRRKKVHVPAAFLGGSFVSDTLDPSDVDAALIFDASRITKKQTFTDLAAIVKDPKSDGLQVDAFLIQWHPDGTELGGGNYLSYVTERSRWDDFWQRKVAKADRQPPQRHHSMPIRGYVEVIIDGYR